MRINIVFETDGTSGLSLEVILSDPNYVKIGIFSLFQLTGTHLPKTPGTHTCILTLEPLRLSYGKYILDVATSVANSGWDHYAEHVIRFQVSPRSPGKAPWDFRHDAGVGAFALHATETPTFTQNDLSSKRTHNTHATA